MTDIVIAVIVAVVLASAICYIRREKKKGNGCIGCPDSCSCTKKDCLYKK